MHTQSKLFSTFVRGLIVVSLALTTNVSNSAEVLFQQAVIEPDVNGFLSDASSINGDDFSVAHVNVESIAWWGGYINQSTDDFVVKLFDDLSDTPSGISALSGNVSVLQTLFDINTQQNYYQYQLVLSNPLELLAGNYFLSIQNIGTSDWAWLFGNNGNDYSVFYVDPDLSWSEDTFTGKDMAFSLEGSRIQTIPEPTTLLLLLLGFSLLIVTHKSMQNTLQA